MSKKIRNTLTTETVYDFFAMRVIISIVGSAVGIPTLEGVR